MSTIIQLKQGSSEWLAYRLTMRNASETAAMLGLSPWTTPYQLWLLKTGRKSQAANPAMQHGTDMEPAAREAYEVMTGEIMQPLVLQDGAYSASLDGLTLDGDLIVEIKCPVRGQDSALWKDVADGTVPGHYGVQVQHQLMVSGAATAHLWVFDGAHGLLSPIERDEAVMQGIRKGWDLFQCFMDSDTPPPLTDADTVFRDDAGWTQAAQAYAKAKLASDTADAGLAAARDALVALTSRPREQGFGVAVTRFWKVGNVDYKKVPVLQGIDLSGYRGKAREEVRVTPAN